MAGYPSVILHNNKAHAVKRFHPWVFSGAVKRIEGTPLSGDIVEVLTEKGEYLATGHYGTGSIAVRLFAFDKINNLEQHWQQTFKKAFDVRIAAALANSATTNAYRLINAEGDNMPGLIVDWYNGTAVIQAHSKGMYQHRQSFVEALNTVYGTKLKAVYDKSSATLHQTDENKTADSYLQGTFTGNEIMENGHRFIVDWEKGQKTGFFIDQRDNRALLSKYVSGKSVLNTFCYSGGFSVYAVTAGAKLVHSVDSSVKAVEWTTQNIELNNTAGVEHNAYVADVFDFLRDAGSNYDVVVLDPPAFAKGQSARHSAIKAYTRLNHAAFKKIKPGGIIFTFSCSQVVNQEMFMGAVTAAAIESGRKIKVLHHLTQPADHPVSIFNPEGLYLKGLVLYVD